MSADGLPTFRFWEEDQASSSFWLNRKLISPPVRHSPLFTLRNRAHLEQTCTEWSLQFPTFPARPQISCPTSPTEWCVVTLSSPSIESSSPAYVPPSQHAHHPLSGVTDDYFGLGISSSECLSLLQSVINAF